MAKRSIGQQRMPIATINAVVSEHLGPARVEGNAQPHALYRHIAMYLCKHLGGWSTTQIGRFYHGRDHSTVHYAIRKVEALRAVDAEIELVLFTLAEALSTRQLRPAIAVKSAERRPTNADGFIFTDAVLDTLADRFAARLANRNGRPAQDVGAPLPERHGDALPDDPVVPP